MNNKYKIVIESPLLRAGIRIETECSERYVVPVVNKVMDMVREINNSEPEKTLEELFVDMDICFEKLFENKECCKDKSSCDCKKKEEE